MVFASFIPYFFFFAIKSRDCLLVLNILICFERVLNEYAIFELRCFDSMQIPTAGNIMKKFICTNGNYGLPIESIAKIQSIFALNYVNSKKYHRNTKYSLVIWIVQQRVLWENTPKYFKLMDDVLWRNECSYALWWV